MEKKPLEEQIDPTTQKIVTPPNLDEDLKRRLMVSIMELVALRDSVEARKNGLDTALGYIKDKIDSLVDKYKIKLDKKEYEASEKSITEYKQILDNVNKEIEMEIARSYAFVPKEEDKLEKIVVPIDANESFLVQYVENRIKFTKKLVKDINKNISISFSRFTFGMEEQERRIQAMDLYLNNKSRKN